MTSFLPSRHGYNFVNSFSQLPSIPNSPIPRLPPIKSGYGLCGGMALGARETFLAGRPIPSDRTQPASGTPLFNYLWLKLLETFGPGFVNIAKFTLWSGLPDGTLVGVRALSHGELPGILAEIDRRRPAVVGQVLVAGADIWSNHQVLAYAYSRSGSTVTLRIYDPNLPDRDDVVMEFKRVAVGRRFGTRRGWRGIPIPTVVTVYGYEITQVVPRASPLRRRVRGAFHIKV